MAKAKRVLLLVTQADWGGVQGFLIRFGAALKADGREVLLAAAGEGRLWDEALKAGLATHRLTKLKREIDPIHDIAAVREIMELIAAFKPDAVHLNSSKIGVVGSIACALSKPRPQTVYRIGGWAFLEPLPEWKRTMYRWAEQLTAPYKDIILTVHPGDAALATKLSIRPRQGVHIAVNGIDLDAFVPQLRSRDEARRELDLSSDAFLFGTIANAYPSKALPQYIRSLEQILPELPNAIACLIGAGPGYEELKAQVASSPIRDRIVLAGDRPDAGRLCLAFDAFVLPSRKEGMPWTLLEAMSAGLPCLATDVGANAWMLNASTEPAGMIVPARDTKALTEAMRRLFTDADLRVRLGKNARDEVQRRFTWQQTFEANRAALDK